jgi:outer membrane protein insertion porin family
MKLKLLAALIPLLFAASAQAIEPFVVKDIRVEGIQRTEAGTVFSYLPIKVGETFNDELSAAAIRALFATGFFKDVRLETERGVLVVVVRERPAIASVEINGAHEFPKEQLAETLKFIGLVEGRIFDKSALDKAEQELKQQYVARGKYGVVITRTVAELERNRVSVTLDVEEGDVSKIRQINIVGNHAYSESELRDLIKLTDAHSTGWFSRSDQYSKQKLSADIEALRSFYLDAGYLEFAMDSTQVSITPDKKDIYLTLNLSEGDKYTVSDIKLSGPEKILPHDKMRPLIGMKTGDVFSRKALTESTQKIGDLLGDDGYAFANINAVPELDKDKHTVAFTFVVDPAQRVYVRRINIAGNSKTSDAVIRREFRQLEGAWFATSKIKKSKQKVDRLDFFSDVNIETPPVTGSTDQLDIEMNVKERSTGDFALGAGLSSGEGVVLTASITERNLFGTGNYLSTQINTSKINQVYSVSYTNPYYTDDGISRGFDVYKRYVNTATTATSAYASSTLGAGVRYGIPIGEDDTLHFGVSAEQTKLGLVATSPQRYLDYVKIFGTSTTNLLTTVGWSHDTRDSAIYTTEGQMRSLYAEVALPVSNQQYYKLTLQQQWFHPLNKDISLMLNGEVGVGNGYGSKPLPFFKNYYAGGTGSVRGYEPGSLGPRDKDGNALGGNRRVVANAELLFPVPGMSKEKSVRLSAFVDVGGVYGAGNVLLGSDGLRTSTGVAVAWISPVGPLKLSLGIPLSKKPTDKLQRFQFTLGNIF